MTLMLYAKQPLGEMTLITAKALALAQEALVVVLVLVLANLRTALLHMTASN